MKIIPKTKKDFAWVNFTPADIRKKAKKSIVELEEKLELIKRVPKEKRNFENTVYALESAGEVSSVDHPMFFLHYVSTNPSVRKASEEMEEYIMKASVDIDYDKDIYRAFLEYDPKSENLSMAEKRLYDVYKRSFERKGFNLPEKTQEKIKKIKKEISVLGIKFTANIAKHHDFILCTREELDGLPENYISNLKKDSKSKKFVVTLAYPEMRPFMLYAENENKRRELADKISQRGGKENIKILKKMLVLRKELATLLGYKNFADYEVEETIAKDSKTIEKFLTQTIKKLIPGYKKDVATLQKYVKQNFGDIKLSYFNSGYYQAKMKKEMFGYDPNTVKEYFEIDNVIGKMFGIFGELFNVRFRENKTFPKWHKDVMIIDVIDADGSVFGNIGFDLFPRKDKFSHMACWNLLKGHRQNFRSKNYLATVSIIVGNFPNKTKNSPSLLSFDEMETLFHEFGHAMHGVLTRASFTSQSGTSVRFDFVETPSQLFENWLDDARNIKSISKHYKTGKSLDNETINKMLKSKKFGERSEFYSIFVMSLQDLQMHTNKFNVDPLILDKQIREKYFSIPQSPKSLFPAGWGHMTDYAAKYYAYMWAIVYSYDIFSRFKKEGIMNKKVGMELRRKILEKGDSEDPIKLMTDFLGRKPNNKAFLEALK